MNRALIFPAADADHSRLIAHEPGEAWSAQVARAVEADDHASLIGLLSGPDGKRRMLEGFSINGGAGNSFAQLCLHHARASALRAVVEASPGGLTLGHCCTYHQTDTKSGLEVHAHRSLHEDAVALASPEALALAIQFEPAHPCTKLRLPRFSGRSLHYEALYQATMSTTVERCKALADCCRLLLSAGAPIGSASVGVSGPVDMLFRYRWNMDGIQAVVVPLIGDYVRSGEVDLNGKEPSGQYPAGIAALAGNGYAAAAAIDLGCDLGLAASGTDRADIISAARACLVSHCVDETVALVTAAVMRRQIGSAVDATAELKLPGTGRRARRVSV